MNKEQWRQRKINQINEKGYFSSCTTADGVQIRSRLYNIWCSMKNRCYRPSHSAYKYYGGKGIDIDWDSYHDFREWAVNNGYGKDLQIDRIDSDGNYCSNNCRWVTAADNIRHAVSTRDNGYLKNRKRDEFGRFA